MCAARRPKEYLLLSADRADGMPGRSEGEVAGTTHIFLFFMKLPFARKTERGKECFFKECDPGARRR